MGPPKSTNIQMDDPFANHNGFRLKPEEKNGVKLIGWLNNHISGTPFIENPPHIDVDLWAVMDDNDEIAVGVAIESKMTLVQ